MFIDLVYYKKSRGKMIWFTKIDIVLISDGNAKDVAHV